MRKFLLILLVILPLVACQPTGDSSQDQQAAQSFFPTFDGYAVEGLQSVQDAVLGGLTAAGIGTGNLPFSAVCLMRVSILNGFQMRLLKGVCRLQVCWWYSIKIGLSKTFCPV
jgi:hypothetical protein